MALRSIELQKEKETRDKEIDRSAYSSGSTVAVIYDRNQAVKYDKNNHHNHNNNHHHHIRNDIYYQEGHEQEEETDVIPTPATPLLSERGVGSVYCTNGQNGAIAKPSSYD